MNNGLLVVLSGPSGSGKDTLLELFFRSKRNAVRSVSATTRAKREGEKDGLDYFFVTREAFREMIERGEMLEYTEYAGNYYGTPKLPVQKSLEKGLDVFLKIEVEGAGNVKRLMPEAVSIFILPPSFEELERRLRLRNTEDSESLQKRLAIAKEELKLAESYDYRVINDDPEEAVRQIEAIIEKEKEVGYYAETV